MALFSKKHIKEIKGEMKEIEVSGMSNNEIVEIAAKLIRTGTYAFKITDPEVGLMLEVNGFYGPGGYACGKLSKDEWRIYNIEHQDLFIEFEELDADVYKQLALEQLDKEDYLNSFEVWKDWSKLKCQINKLE